MPQPVTISYVDFKAAFETLLDGLPAGLVKDRTYFSLPSNLPPWFDTGIDLSPGDAVTTFADGRTRLDGTELWFDAGFQLWVRIGKDGHVFRGTRASHSFTAETGGRLYLGSYFPGEWATRSGDLATPPEAYGLVSGALSVAVIRWSADPGEALPRMLSPTPVKRLIEGEIDRLRNPVSPPDGWQYLWFLGPAETYRPCASGDHSHAICCHTKRDAGLLIKEARAPFAPGVKLRWSWKVDKLPSETTEEELATHDYLSIAVEFDNGQDLTYFWSAGLPVGMSFRCPIPTWAGRETHMVVRSGREGLGQWLDDERDVWADYAQAIGGEPPANVVRVWLIAVSLFQGGEGRCQYSDIALASGGETIRVY